MATNFSPSSGSYVLNKFPSISSGAIQGHHGPLVFDNVFIGTIFKASSVYFQDANEQAAYVKIDRVSRHCRPWLY